MLCVFREHSLTRVVCFPKTEPCVAGFLGRFGVRAFSEIAVWGVSMDWKGIAPFGASDLAEVLTGFL
jgi:hypothetical protein